MEIKKIKFNQPGMGVRELTASGEVSVLEWKKVSKKVLRFN